MTFFELHTLALHKGLMRTLRDLLGEDMMLHLCLTGWVSTKRDWHQHDYLNSWTCQQLLSGRVHRAGRYFCPT